MTLQSIKLSVLAVAAGIFISGCANTAHVEKARTADLANYKTYSWVATEKNIQQLYSPVNTALPLCWQCFLHSLTRFQVLMQLFIMHPVFFRWQDLGLSPRCYQQ